MINPQIYPLGSTFSASPHHLPKQHHLLWTKPSNTWAFKGHFSFKPQHQGPLKIDPGCHQLRRSHTSEREKKVCRKVGQRPSVTMRTKCSASAIFLLFVTHTWTHTHKHMYIETYHHRIAGVNSSWNLIGLVHLCQECPGSGNGIESAVTCPPSSLEALSGFNFDF